MTFELSEQQQAARDRARGFAEDRLAPVAASIDDSATIPADVLGELRAVAETSSADATTVVVSVEELAIASAAAAAASALEPAARSAGADAVGLRGFRAADVADPRGRLVFAAVATGIGRAAIREALRVLRGSGARRRRTGKATLGRGRCGDGSGGRPRAHASSRAGGCRRW